HLALALARQHRAGRVQDYVCASDEAERTALWQLRASLSAAQKLEGPSIKHDVAVPLGAMSEFIARGTELVGQLLPGAQVLAFGHLGDGNVHFNIGAAPQWSRERFLAHWEPVAAAVHDL